MALSLFLVLGFLSSGSCQLASPTWVLKKDNSFPVPVYVLSLSVTLLFIPSLVFSSFFFFWVPTQTHYFSNINPMAPSVLSIFHNPYTPDRTLMFVVSFSFPPDYLLKLLCFSCLCSFLVFWCDLSSFSPFPLFAGT